jgi:CheY-like chemotaxis protein
MIVRSAASLSRPGTEAPASLLRPFAERAPQPAPQGAPPGRTPASLAVSDPPRGKILLVGQQAVIALDLQRILRDAGFRLVGPATTPEQLERLTDRISVDCAIVDLQADRETALAAIEALESAGVPCVCLADQGSSLPDTASASLVRKPYSRDGLLAAIERAMVEERGRQHFQYPVPPPVRHWPRVFPQL